MKKVVPSGIPISSSPFSAPPSIRYWTPAAESLIFVRSSTCAIAAILESASPRNPREDIPVRSSTDRILLVECLKKASGTSSFGIPTPLSAIRIREIPPSLISTVTAVAFASIAFSTSSFTIDAGRSITSPAAILSTVIGSKT